MVHGAPRERRTYDRGARKDVPVWLHTNSSASSNSSVRLAETGRLGYRRDERKLNMDTLARIGVTVAEMLDRIARLEPHQALHSPWENRNPGFPHETTCDFGIFIEETGIYVKICIGVGEEEPAGCVISFHPQDRPFEFPFDK